MLSSFEISQMMAAQQQGFAGQRSFAEQVGIPNQGLNAYGNPGGAPMGSGFSYAPKGWGSPGLGQGNRIGGMAMAGVAAAAPLALGLGSAFSQMGLPGSGAMNALTNPLWAFKGMPRMLGGAGLGGAGMSEGAGLAMGLAGAALPIGVGLLATHAASSLATGGMQQSAINSQLGQNFNFFNSQSRTGMGFTRTDAKAIGDQIRSLADMPELLTSMDELTKMLPKLKSAGVMQGVKDAAEFSRRFKESIKTIRDVSKVLGTSMEEASEFFSQSRQQGFLGRGAQMQNVLNAQFTSGVTGMSMGQTMALGQAGAGMAVGVGARRSIGSQATTNAAQMIGLAQRSGAIREGLVGDVTGMEGEEGTQAAAQRLTQLMIRASGTAPGRAVMAGLAKFDEKGRAVGLDEDLVRRLNSGEMNLDEVKRRAQNLTREQKISFSARQGTLSMSLASQVGAGGFASFMQGITGKKFGEEGTNLELQRLTGGTESDVDLMMGLVGAGSAGGGEQEVFNRLRQRESNIREKTSPEAIMKRLKTRLHAATFGKIEAAGAKMFTDIGKQYDNFIDDVVGRHIVTLTEEGSKNISRALEGGGGQDLQKMFAAAHGLNKEGSSQTSVGGVLFGPMMTNSFNQLLGKKSSDILNKQFADTDLAAFFTGSSSEANRAGHVQELLGTTDQGEMGQRIEKLMGGAPQSQSISDAQEAISTLKGGIAGYEDMSPTERLLELQKRVSGASQAGLDTEQSKLLRAGLKDVRAFAKENNIDESLALIAASQKGQSGIDLKAALGLKGSATVEQMVRAADNNQKAAEAALVKDYGSSGAALIQSNPSARRALEAVANNNEIAKKAMDPDMPLAQAVDEFGKLGIHLSPDQIQEVRDAHKEFKKNGGDNKTISNFGNALSASSGAAAATLFKNASNEVAGNVGAIEEKFGKEAGQALASFGTALGNISSSGGADDIRKSAQGLIAAASNIKDKGARSAFLKGAGPAGAYLEEVMRDNDQVGKKVGKKVTQEEILKAYHLEGDESAAKILTGEGIYEGKEGGTLTKQAFERIQGVAAAAGVSKAVGSKGEGVTGTTADLVSTLKDLNDTLKLVKTQLSPPSSGSAPTADAAQNGGKATTNNKATTASSFLSSLFTKPPGE